MAIIRGKKRSQNINARKTRVRARRVQIGASDGWLTSAAGVDALRDADRVLGLTAALDAGIAKRFGDEQLAGIETAIGKINTTMVTLLPLVRRTTLMKVVTFGGDAIDIEVYGRSKKKAKHAYTGALTLRAHIAHWAEAGVALAGELMGGTKGPRSNAVDILDRAIGALPEGVEKSDAAARLSAGPETEDGFLINSSAARRVEGKHYARQLA